MSKLSVFDKIRVYLCSEYIMTEYIYAQNLLRTLRIISPKSWFGEKVFVTVILSNNLHSKVIFREQLFYFQSLLMLSFSRILCCKRLQSQCFSYKKWIAAPFLLGEISKNVKQIYLRFTFLY